MKKMPLILFAFLPLLSCEKSKVASPEVEKYKAQEIELEALKAELSELNTEVAAAKTKGPDSPVAELREQFAASEAELEKLNEEFEKLKASEKAAVEALADYKAKFVLKQ